jgi:hypothetical protein
LPEGTQDGQCLTANLGFWLSMAGARGPSTGGGRTCPPTGGPHLIPSQEQEMLDVRLWWKNQMVQPTTLPMSGITVHF